MHIRAKSITLTASMALLAATLLATPASADVFIIESTAPALKAGSQLADNERLSVPDGASVRILLPSGKTQSVKGPYDGAIADIGKGKLDGAGMIGWLRGFLQTGGSSEAVPGATRSLTPPPARSASFSWTSVPTGADSITCIPRGQSPQLKRGVTGKADKVTIIDRDKATRGEAEWTVGSDTAAWPGALALRDGAVYDLLVPDRPKRTLTLRVLARAPDEADVLSVLHAAGCKAQFDAWLRETSLKRR